MFHKYFPCVDILRGPDDDGDAVRGKSGATVEGGLESDPATDTGQTEMSPWGQG